MGINLGNGYSAVVANADSPAGFNDVITSFETGVTQVKNDSFTMMAKATPVVMSIMGALLAVSIGFRFVKRFSK